MSTLQLMIITSKITLRNNYKAFNVFVIQVSIRLFPPKLQDGQYGHTYIRRLNYRDSLLLTLCQIVLDSNIKKSNKKDNYIIK